MRTWPPKDTGETLTISFNFASDLIVGETLTGTPSIAISLASGGIDSAMATMLYSSPQISGANVVQVVIAGLSGNGYYLSATCPTSNGRILVEGGLLRIVPAYLQ